MTGRAVHAVRKAIVIMRDEVGDQVEVQTFDLFCLLALRPDQPMLHLAEELNISLSATSRNVEKLKKRELVRRQEDPEDRRNKRINLTAKGKRIIERIDEECSSIMTTQGG